MKEYKTPEAFKNALETRIRTATRESGGDMGRFRQVLVFDRFLARAHQQFEDNIVVKGGVVLELRLEHARATKDVDLRLTGNQAGVLSSLQTAGQLDLGDWMTFEIREDPDHPTIEGAGVIYDGCRFRAEAKVAGKLYGSPFGVDVGFADAMTEPAELFLGSDFLAFANVPPPQLRIYPRSTHIAEKLHAYTLPRERPNTRVKDLPDIALLASLGPLVVGDLREAIDATFTFRGTHALPTKFPPPPADWAKQYERIAKTNRLPWTTLEAVTLAAQRFLTPVLERSVSDVAAWDRPSERWL